MPTKFITKRPNYQPIYLLATYLPLLPTQQSKQKTTHPPTCQPNLPICDRYVSWTPWKPFLGSSRKRCVTPARAAAKETICELATPKMHRKTRRQTFVEVLPRSSPAVKNTPRVTLCQARSFVVLFPRTRNSRFA